VGVSADRWETLAAFTKQNNVRHPLLSDFPRKMLPAFDAMVTEEQSPIYRYARRAYFVIDRNGVVKYVKVQASGLDLLDPLEVLKAYKAAGA
jgi:peroxiredoxin